MGFLEDDFNLTLCDVGLVDLQRLQKVDRLENVDREFSEDGAFEFGFVLVLERRVLHRLLLAFVADLGVVRHEDFVADGRRERGDHTT